MQAGKDTYFRHKCQVLACMDAIVYMQLYEHARMQLYICSCMKKLRRYIFLAVG